MERIVGFVAGISMETWIAAGIAAAVAAVAVLILLAQQRFRRFVKTAALDPAALAGGELGVGTQFFRERYVLRRARGGFRGSPGPFPRLPETLGFGKRWMAALKRGGDSRTMARVLEFLPDSGLAACFRAALRREGLGRQLLIGRGRTRAHSPCGGLRCPVPGGSSTARLPDPCCRSEWMRFGNSWAIPNGRSVFSLSGSYWMRATSGPSGASGAA